MKTRTYQFLALAAVMTLYPVAASYAYSTTPPTEQGSTPGTTPMKKHHHHHKMAMTVIHHSAMKPMGGMHHK